MKSCPSIAVSSPASLETLYFPFNYSPLQSPSATPPALLSLAAHGQRRGSLPFCSLGLFFFSFAFVAQN